MSAFLALCLVIALASGDPRAVCLDLGTGCSPAAAIPMGPCHNDRDTSPDCTSCVDILVPEAVSACSGRPDHDLRTPGATRSSSRASAAATLGDALAASPAFPLRRSPRQPFPRIAVLRI